jgi:hypothetical protein
MNNTILFLISTTPNNRKRLLPSKELCCYQENSKQTWGSKLAHARSSQYYAGSGSVFCPKVKSHNLWHRRTHHSAERVTQNCISEIWSCSAVGHVYKERGVRWPVGASSTIMLSWWGGTQGHFYPCIAHNLTTVPPVQAPDGTLHEVTSTATESMWQYWERWKSENQLRAREEWIVLLQIPLVIK